MSRRACIAATLTAVALALATGCPGSAGRASGTDGAPAPAGADTATSSADRPDAPADPGSDPGAADATATATAGTWSGPATGGYRGDTITFTVTADGRLTDVTVEGNWRCDGSTELIDIGHFPDDVAVAGGRFAATQRADYQLQWEISGAFDGDRASGTVRIMSSTDCDTYELDWTASPQ